MRSDRDERGERGKKKISVRFPDTLPLGPQPAERFTRGAMRWYWTSLVDGPMLLRLLADGGGSSGRGQPAASPPFPAPPQTWWMAAGFGLQANGGDSSAPSRTAATPPRPRSTAASLPSHLFFFCSSTTASGSHWRSPLLPAARSPQHHDPPQQRGLSDSVSLLPPGFRHQCNEVDIYGKKEAGTGEHLRHFNNKINKHKWKAAAPHGRLPHTKHKLKSRPGPLSSSTVVTPHLTLPKLLRGTRDWWVVQVSFITNYSTGLAPFPRLSAPPHSSQCVSFELCVLTNVLCYVSGWMAGVCL